jgi:flavin-dependent dehydrogenase
LFAGPFCYGGLAAVEGGRWNAAFSLPAAMIRRHGGDVEAAFAEVTAFNPTLAGRLKGARRVARWLAAPLPRFAVRHDWPEHVVPIGNAAAALEPIGGEGMGLAIRSAELAVSQIVGATATPRGLAADYGRLWRVRRAACRLVARTVSNPAWADRVSSLLQDESPATRLGMRLMGKTS